MAKKLVALLLSALMVTSCIAACSKDDEDSDSEGGNSGDAIQDLIDSTGDSTVKLTVWASEEDQEFTQTLINGFKAEYPDVKFDITLEACSESTAKDTVLTDISAAADVFAFADDQINELVRAGALLEVTDSYTYDVREENLGGSVEAATVDGKLYAYPMTADNGYFLYYDSNVYSESDVASLDAMMAAASASGTQIGMCVSDAWYLYSFFKGAGLELGLNDDGVTNTCNWNTGDGTAVAQAIIDLCTSGTFVNAGDDAGIMTGVNDGKYSAVVSGMWNAQAIEAAYGDGYAATRLPTFTMNGSQVQMSSFSGYKLIGVNATSAQAGWATLLAEYLTNETSQIARFEARGLGPSNIVAAGSDAVQSNPAIAALAAQAEFATPQRVGGNYWSPAASLGSILASGNPDGTALQTLLDDCVAGIEAPVI